MAGFIPEDIVERIKSETDLVDLISEYVNLRKAGKDYLALCPFHREKTPSFTVVPAKGFFYCFGCGASGNAVNFIMRHENLDYGEALRFLARRAGITIPERRDIQQSRTEKYYQALEFAAAFYRKALRNSPAQRYFAARGLSAETQAELGLGYAPDGWDNLLTAVMKEKLSPELFFDVGLLVKREGRSGEYYDRFRNRALFPIYSISGKVLGFGGRALSEQDAPKYLNSPETSVYHKGSVLYGLNFTKNYIRDSQVAVILEGYFDFATAYQAGLKNIVAVSGTGFTPNQANLLARFCDKVILLYDADSAGMKATFRAVEVLYNAGLEPYIARLPEGNDPDTFIRNNGLGAIEKLLQSSPDYIEFIKNSLPDVFHRLPISKQQKIIDTLAQNAAGIDDPLRHELFVRKAIEIFGLPAEAAVKFKRPQAAPAVAEKTTALSGRAKFESLFLGFVLAHPEFIPESARLIKGELFIDDIHKEIFQKLTEEDFGKFHLGDFIGKFPDDGVRRRITEIVVRESAGAPPETLFAEFMAKFKAFSDQDRLAMLRVEIAKAEKEGHKQKLEQLTRAYRDIQNAAKGKAT